MPKHWNNLQKNCAAMRISAGILALVFLVSCSQQDIDQPPLFPNLQGPAPNDMPTLQPGLGMADFQGAGSDALAVWVNDPESSWLGLALGLKSIGVPFRIVESMELAQGHDVIMVYPSLTGSNTVPEDLRSLAEHVRTGGTLLAFNVIGGGMPGLMGFETSTESRTLQGIQFSDDSFNDSYASSPAESRIPLTPAGQQESALPGIRYHNPKHQPIAFYTDGSAAITQNFFSVEEGGTGYAYGIGLDLGHFILRSFNGRFSGLSENYVNTYQPKVDTFLRFIAKVYRQGESHAVLLSPTPEAKDLTILLTHDIDFTASILNVPAYAAYEAETGISATYFIQTKYVRDYNDDYFFEPNRAPILQELDELGMEIASHSVAHSNEFRHMPLGTGQESYPEYRPFVQNFSEVRNASVAGELRISKYLLEETSNQTVTSFRPGHLSLPESLPQMLSATGYAFSSSITANEAMTHLPYRTMYNRSYESTTETFEFPVTIEDEESPLIERLEESIELAERISVYRGLVNLLIHTETVGDKLEFEKAFVSRFRDSAWFGTMRQYGDWWKARETVAIQFVEVNDSRGELTVSTDMPVTGLTLELPENWRYRGGLEGTRQQGNLLSLGHFEASAVLELETP